MMNSNTFYRGPHVLMLQHKLCTLCLLFKLFVHVYFMVSGSGVHQASARIVETHGCTWPFETFFSSCSKTLPALSIAQIPPSCCAKGMLYSTSGTIQSQETINWIFQNINHTVHYSFFMQFYKTNLCIDHTRALADVYSTLCNRVAYNWMQSSCGASATSCLKVVKSRDEHFKLHFAWNDC